MKSQELEVPFWAWPHPWEVLGCVYVNQGWDMRQFCKQKMPKFQHDLFNYLSFQTRMEGVLTRLGYAQCPAIHWRGTELYFSSQSSHISKEIHSFHHCEGHHRIIKPEDVVTFDSWVLMGPKIKHLAFVSIGQRNLVNWGIWWLSW